MARLSPFVPFGLVLAFQAWLRPAVLVVCLRHIVMEMRLVAIMGTNWRQHLLLRRLAVTKDANGAVTT